MTVHWVSRLRRLCRWGRHAIAPGALVLLYHRVAVPGSDPWALSVTPQHFAEHLEVIRKQGYPVSLQQLNGALRDRKRSPRSIAITFDDGYANNFHEARPLLERYDIPATVFVTSGYMGKSEEFWWDELDQILLQSRRLPEELRLHIKGGIHAWTLGSAVEYGEEDRRRDIGRPAQEAEAGSRLFFYYSIWQQLQPLPDEQRREALDEIIAWANMTPIVRETHRLLSFEEARTLGQGGLVEVGSHTRTHPVLTAHSLEFQRYEISQSKADLEAVLHYPVNSFSFPHGKYTAETTAFVRDAGFTSACTSIFGIVRRRTDPFQLPRVEVRDWDGEEFAKWLSEWFYQ